VDLRRQIVIARKWIPLLAVSVLLAASAAFIFSSVQQKVYEARATLIVGQSLQALNPDFNQLMVSQRLSTTYATVATKRPALERVIEVLGLDETPDQLSKRVWAEAPTDSTLLNLNAQDTDPARAAAIANALADQLIAASPAIQGRQTDLQKSIDADLKATQDQIRTTQAEVERLATLASPKPDDVVTLETLQGRLVTLRSTYASLLQFSAGNASNLLSVVEPAVAPDSPVSPRPLMNTLLAAVAGLLVAGALVAVIEYLDDTVKDADTVQEIAGLSTLGTVTRIEAGRGRAEIYRLATLLYPRSAAAEAYRTLRTNIEFAAVDAPVHTLLVTSSGSGEGKTVTAANLAVAFAQAGRPTLLVDADLRKPGTNIIFELPNTQGLTSLLRTDEVTVDSVAHATEQANLRVLTTGPLPPNPAELLSSQRMRVVLERLKAAAELVIFDAPPLQAVTDAAVLSSYLDATVYVVDAGHSRRGAVRQGREMLARAGANVLGVILNRVPKASQSTFYGYYGEEDASGTVAQKRPPMPEESREGSAS
jgi:polysaccharide biosynthesis transport protein